jgi:prephenate dehydrogenase
MASMMTRRDADVAVIGLGVIGGSAALRLKERGTELRAFSTGVADAAEATRAGVIVTDTLDEAVREVGLVLIAVPVDRVCAVADQVVGAAPNEATILHAASLQRIEALQLRPETAARVIGTHPLAGSHRTGFGAARADMFRDATVYAEIRATKQQREDAEFFWSLAGAKRVEYLSASAHDDAMAWVSHLPQLASTALAAALASMMAAPLENARVPLGPGGRDATRLAMSGFGMWQPILDRAPSATLSALAALESSVERLRAAVESRDWKSVEKIWSAADAWRSDMEHGGGGRE